MPVALPGRGPTAPWAQWVFLSKPRRRYTPHVVPGEAAHRDVGEDGSQRVTPSRNRTRHSRLTFRIPETSERARPSPHVVAVRGR